MRGRVWGPLAIAIALAAGATGVVITQGPSSPGSGLANIWVDSNGGTCADSASVTAYVDANACASLDAANDTCESGDLVYVKTSTAYSTAQVLNGSNSRGSVDCVIAAEPETGRFRVNGDITLGANNDEANNPNHLTIRGAQCGDTTSYTNAADLTAWDTDDVTIDNWACSSFDLFGMTNTLVENSDFGICGSNSSPQRKCVNRISHDTSGECCVTVEDTSLHDIWCGTGSTVQCGLNHTDGLAIFGGDQITLRRVKFYRNDITNIRMQQCCGNLPLTNITIETSWFNAPCIDGASGSNCTGGQNGNAFDIDTGCANCIIRFNTFADQTAPQCTSGTCGTSGNPTVFTGNIMSTIQAFCSYGFITMNYNAMGERGGSGTADCGTDRYSATYPTFVNSALTASPPNFHLSGTGNANDLVDSSYCIGVDIDEAQRLPTPCNAGSDQD